MFYNFGLWKIYGKKFFCNITSKQTNFKLMEWNLGQIFNFLFSLFPGSEQQGPYSLQFIFKSLSLFQPLLLFFINFLIQFKIFLLTSVLLRYSHIHTHDDFLYCGTLLSPEIGWSNLPESTEGESPLSVCTSVLCFSAMANSRG
jgi:hypothetical protein